jgi:hypothetical protein
MGERRWPLTLRRMPPPSSVVIVIRAWCEADGVRVRLLTDGGGPKQWMVGSIGDACDVVGAVLSELTVAPARPEQAGPRAANR